MSIRGNFIQLAKELEREAEAASELWTWLPSYRAAVKAHGDYASEHMPSVVDVMREAAEYFAHKLAPTAEQIREAGDFYRCPCQECGTYSNDIMEILMRKAEK